jgi:hypothetical protein
VITFGGNAIDFEIMEKHSRNFNAIAFDNDKINIVYIGRGGHDLEFSLDILFGSFAEGLKKDAAVFERVQFWFIGTSYAAPGLGNKTILPIACKHKLEKQVTEITDRASYFETLFLLKKADLLCMLGSTDVSYTASKLFPYILAQKPLLGIFYHTSSVVDIITKTRSGEIVSFDGNHPATYYFRDCEAALKKIIENRGNLVNTDWKAFEPYSAHALTRVQVDFFNHTTS